MAAKGVKPEAAAACIDYSQKENLGAADYKKTLCLRVPESVNLSQLLMIRL